LRLISGGLDLCKVRVRKVFEKNNAAVEKGIREFYESLPKSHQSKKHSRYNKVDDIGVWRDDNMSWPGGGGPTYDVIHPETKIACAVPEGGWRYGKIEKMEEMIRSGKVVFRADHSEPPIRKTYLVELDEEIDFDEDSELDETESDDLPIQVAGSYFYRSALQASNELNQLFGKKVFNNPKDKEVIARWISYIDVSDEDIVMDFFAGSGTTGHAVLEVNALGGKAVRYILVQLPEVINPKTKGAKPAVDFLDKLKLPCVVSELTKERLRRAGKKIKTDNAGKNDIDKLDIGFRVLKIDSSNMSDVYYSPDEVKQGDLLAQINNIREGRTEEDLLFQVLLDWGVDLSLPITREVIAGKNVFFVDGNALAACFEVGIDESFVKLLAAKHPLRAVFFDAGFASDSVKINIEQIFNLVSPTTEIKTI
jgi:adenine-specific DNA-methyltransferase